MIVYGAPLLFLLGTMLIHQLRSHAKMITPLLQSIAVLLGCVLAVSLAASFPDAATFAKVDAIAWTGPMTCPSDKTRDGHLSFEQLGHDYGLGAN